MGKRLWVLALAAGMTPSLQTEYIVAHQMAVSRSELRDATTEQKRNDATLPLRRRRYLGAKEAAGVGGVSESVYLEAELALKVAEVEADLLRWKIKAIEARIGSLESLRQGKDLDFLKGDRDASLAQLRWYEFEVTKALLIYQHAERRYQRVHKLAGTGAISGATDLQREMEMQEAQVAHQGWVDKRKDQESLYQAAEMALHRP